METISKYPSKNFERDFGNFCDNLGGLPEDFSERREYLDGVLRPVASRVEAYASNGASDVVKELAGLAGDVFGRSVERVEDYESGATAA